MAIFHLTAKVISRGKGQSAVAAAAYRSGERLRDEQANEQKFYQARAERIEFTAIMAPKDAPDWAQDRNQLWNHVERGEKRKDAQLAREIEIALPHELTPQQREWLVKDFAREAFVRKGYAVDIAIHAPDKTSDERNHHAHIMVTMRTLDGDGFAAKKDPSMNRREQLGEWREQWAHLANRHLERHGHEARIDHRSLKQQGIEREAGIHLGYAANEMAQRGAQSDRMDALKQIIDRNDIRVEMGKIERELAQLERTEKAQTREAAPSSFAKATSRTGRNKRRIKPRQRQPSPPRNRTREKRSEARSRPAPRRARRERSAASRTERPRSRRRRSTVWRARSRVCSAAVLAGLRSRGRSPPTPRLRRAGPPRQPRASRSLRHPRRSQRQRGCAMRRGLQPLSRRSGSNARRVAKNCCATTGARCRRKTNATRRLSATSASNATEGEAGANARPTGAGRTPDGQGQQPRKSAGGQSHAAAGDGRAGAATPRADRWSLCRRFVYQFSLIAKPKPKPPPPSAKKRKGRHGGDDGWRGRRWRPTPIKARKLGLAAVKHKQQQAERTERTEQQGRAFVALAHVVADAGGGGWPESMQRELQGLPDAAGAKCLGAEMGRRISADRWSARSGERRSDRRHAAGMRAARVSRRKVMF